MISFCKSFCGAKPTQKVRWTNAGVGWRGCMEILARTLAVLMMRGSVGTPPEGQWHGTTVGSGVFEMVGGVIVAKAGA